MSVIDEIAAATGLDHDKAESAAGAILAAIRMSAPGDAFAPVERAIPEAKAMILKAGAGMSGGRTGEMVAMVSELRSPAGVAKLTSQLSRAGLTPAQVGQAARALIDFVRKQAGDDSVKPLLDALPGFRDLVQ